MNILLVGVNAKFTHTNPAIRYLRTYLRDSAGYESQIAEYTINNDRGSVLRSICEKNPDVVGFSVYIWNVSFILALIDDLKQVLPNVVVIVGGPEVSFDSESGLYSSADHVISGEGEKSFAGIIRDIARGEKPDRVVYEDGVADLDDMAFIYDDIDSLENRTIYYESSRGCPYSCSYCLSSASGGVRFAGLDKVFRDLSVFIDKKVMQVKFVDRTFNANPARAVEIMKFVSEQDNGYTNFHFEITASIIDDDTLEFLKNVRPGLLQFEIGLQTTNPDSIASISRNMPKEKTLERCREIIARSNAKVHLDLIAGLPHEKYESFLSSIDDAMSVRPHVLQIGFLKMLKGSRIRRESDEHIYAFSRHAPYEVLSNRYVTYNDICAIKDIEEVVEIGYNSNILKESFFAASSVLFSSRISHFLEAFSIYLRQTGFFDEHKRREEIIYAYAAFIRVMGQQHLSETERGVADALVELAAYEAFSLGVRNLREMAVLDISSIDDSSREKLHSALSDEAFRVSLNPRFENLKARDVLKKVSILELSYDVDAFVKSAYSSVVHRKHIMVFDITSKDAIFGKFPYMDIDTA